MGKRGRSTRWRSKTSLGRKRLTSRAPTPSGHPSRAVGSRCLLMSVLTESTARRSVCRQHSDDLTLDVRACTLVDLVVTDLNTALLLRRFDLKSGTRRPGSQRVCEF